MEISKFKEVKVEAFTMVPLINVLSQNSMEMLESHIVSNFFHVD